MRLRDVKHWGCVSVQCDFSSLASNCWGLLTGICEVELDRPDAKNSIGRDMLQGLRRAFEDVDKDDMAKVLLICSSVPRVFCAGADLKVQCCLVVLFAVLISVLSIY